MQILCTQFFPSKIWELTFVEAIREPFYLCSDGIALFLTPVCSISYESFAAN